MTRTNALLLLLLVLSILVFPLKTTFAFNGRDLALINVVIPAIRAGWTAYRAGNPVGPAILQGVAGGLIMQKGFELAARTADDDPWKAWQAKGLVNLGASLAESAGRELRFRMDLGPVWVLWDRRGIRFRPGLHSTLAPLFNTADGARFDFHRSLRYGATAFSRPSRRDGTIGSGGALAYSNANNIITPKNGSHVHHEMIHVLQYRRDAFWSPSLGTLFPGIERRLGDSWVDDTGWILDLGLQTLAVSVRNESRDFDIPMEKEAYYLTDRAFGKP